MYVRNKIKLIQLNNNLKHKPQTHTHTKLNKTTQLHIHSKKKPNQFHTLKTT